MPSESGAQAEKALGAEYVDLWKYRASGVSAATATFYHAPSRNGMPGDGAAGVPHGVDLHAAM